MIMINAIDQRAAQSLDSALDSLETGRFKKFDHIVFETQKHGATRLEPASGISVKFEAEAKPRSEIIDTVLNEIGGSRADRASRCEKVFRQFTSKNHYLLTPTQKVGVGFK